MTPATDAAEEIRAVLQSISAAWTEGDVRDLAAFFHHDMVIAGPALEALARGREACVTSYRAFLEQAKLRNYAESDHSIEVVDDTAIASYRFDIAYEMGGQSYRDRGRDLFVFAREDGRWQAVWRAMLPEPPGAPAA